MRSKAAAKAVTSLPSFKHPPVNEVVCGLRFEPLQRLRVPHIGLLWAKFRNDYPVVQHATPIASEASILVDASTGAPLPRIWFVSAEDNQLVQFQSDRFYFNWRERGDTYPRYSTIIKKFESAKQVLDEFISELALDPISATEYELTYINHIPKGHGWETNDDLAKVFRDFNWQRKSSRFLPNPANTSWQVRFPLPEDNGWLNAKLSQAKRRNDETPVLILEISAKGIGSEKTDAAMRHWFDLAHVWIVKGFEDLTTADIQQSVWQKEDDTTSE